MPDVALGSGSMPTAGTIRARTVHCIPAQRGAGLRAGWDERLCERFRAHPPAFAIGAAATRRERAAAASHALDCTLAPRMAHALHASISTLYCKKRIVPI